MKKRIVAIMLVLSTVFTLAACKKNGGELNVKDNMVSMEVGGTHKVELGQEVKNITWESENNGVATVSPDGVITAVGGGITVVSGKTDDAYVHIGVDVKGNSEYVDKDGNVILKFEEESDITEIVVGAKHGMKEEITVRVGEACELVAYTTPSDSEDKGKIVWKSADSTIASVDSKGALKAIGKGKTKINAYAPNGVLGVLLVTVK